MGAAEVRDRFPSSVAANRVGFAHQWGRPCHGFNVHITPSAPARDALARVQDVVAAVVEQLDVHEELAFPSLVSARCARLPLAGSSNIPADRCGG